MRFMVRLSYGPDMGGPMTHAGFYPKEATRLVLSVDCCYIQAPV